MRIREKQATRTSEYQMQTRKSSKNPKQIIIFEQNFLAESDIDSDIFNNVGIKFRSLKNSSGENWEKSLSVAKSSYRQSFRVFDLEEFRNFGSKI